MEKRKKNASYLIKYLFAPGNIFIFILSEPNLSEKIYSFPRMRKVNMYRCRNTRMGMGKWGRGGMRAFPSQKKLC